MPQFTKRYFKSGLLALLLGSQLMACVSYPPLEKAEFVDAEQFKGSWYVIANIPYFAERNKVGSKTTYLHREGKLYDDIFEAHDQNFDSDYKKLVGKVKSLNEQNNEWRSTFYWVINFKFAVLHVDPDYELMLLGHKSRKYGWVMARDRQISESDYQRALDTFKQRGYDISQFKKVPQLPEDIGQPGFQSSTK